MTWHAAFGPRALSLTHVLLELYLELVENQPEPQQKKTNMY